MSFLLNRKRNSIEYAQFHSVIFISIYSLRQLQRLGFVDLSDLILFQNMSMPAKIAFIEDEIDTKTKFFYKVTYINIRELKSIRRLKPFIPKNESLYIVLLNRWLMLSEKHLKKLFVFLKIIPENSQLLILLTDVSIEETSALIKKIELILKRKPIIVDNSKMNYSNPCDFLRKIICLSGSPHRISNSFCHREDDDKNVLNKGKLKDC